MILICTLITFFLSAMMFKVKREKKMAIIIFAVITLSSLRMSSPVPGFLSSPISMLCICFILSELIHIKSLFIYIINIRILRIFLFVILLYGLFACIFSPHIQSVTDIYHYFLSEYIFKYFVLFYALFSIKGQNSFKYIVHYSIIAMLILTVFGLINFFLKSNPFLTELISNYASANFDIETIGDKYSLQERFRVQSLFINPFDYGYTCSLMLLLYIYAYKNHMMTRLFFIIMISCCLFGIFLCGCRTIVICSIISFFVYILRAYSIRKSIKYVLYTIICSLIIYSTIPLVQEKIDIALTAITDAHGEEVGGSSLEMRNIQFLAVLYHIQDHPIFGRGVNYFTEDLGWKDGFAGLKDSRLYGIEGVYLKQLLEHGIFGYALYLYSWILLFIYIVKSKLDKHLSAFGFSVIVLYTLFANMTGELLCVFPTLLILGCIIKLLLSTNHRTIGINSYKSS